MMMRRGCPFHGPAMMKQREIRRKGLAEAKQLYQEVRIVQPPVTQAVRQQVKQVVEIPANQKIPIPVKPIVQKLKMQRLKAPEKRAV